MGIKEMREAVGLNMTELSELLGIPYRTIQNWENGSRSCPEYVLQLIEFRLSIDEELKSTLINLSSENIKVIVDDYIHNEYKNGYRKASKYAYKLIEDIREKLLNN